MVTEPVAFADELAGRLEAEATPERAENEKAYLKSDLDFVGVTVPIMRRVTKALHREHGVRSHAELVARVEELWGRGVFELRMAAVELLTFESGRLSPDDVPLLERLLRDARTWALVDPLAATVTGSLVDRFPDAMHPILKGWAEDDDFWLRRSSLLAYLGGLRGGDGYWDRFTALADPMLEEKEFFIRKAIGWVLREAAKKRPERVADWLEPRVDRASGLTVREAVKRLPDDLRERVLAARS